MALIPVNLLRRFRQDPRVNHDFDDEDRRKANIARKLKKIQKTKLEIYDKKLKELKQLQEEKHLQDQIRRLEKQIYDFEDEDEENDEEEDSSWEERFGEQIIDSIFFKKEVPKPAAVPQDLPEIPALDEAQLRAIVKKLPGQVKDFIAVTDYGSLMSLVKLIKEDN